VTWLYLGPGADRVVGVADDRDPSDPPRKFFELKDREFERVNPARPPESAASANPPPPPADASKPIDVRDIYQQAATPGPVLSPGSRRNDPNEVHGILRENLARENAAGLNEVPHRRRPVSRRFRDYVLLMVGLNVGLGLNAVRASHGGDVVGFVSSIAGMGLLSAGVTWVMWFVMDRY
jgi:hypothetical protein